MNQVITMKMRLVLLAFAKLRAGSFILPIEITLIPKHPEIMTILAHAHTKNPPLSI